MMMLNYPNTTETMAERAWRYGEQGVPHWRWGGYQWFIDGSALAPGQVVETRRSLLRLAIWPISPMAPLWRRMEFSPNMTESD